MRCPNCNDVKKKSDQDSILCDYCYEATYSNRALVLGIDTGYSGGRSGIQFLQKKTVATHELDSPTGTIIMWDGIQIPNGFEPVNVPNFAGQNSDFHLWSNGATYPYGEFKDSLNF